MSLENPEEKGKLRELWPLWMKFDYPEVLFYANLVLCFLEGKLEMIMLVVEHV